MNNNILRLLFAAALLFAWAGPSFAQGEQQQSSTQTLRNAVPGAENVVPEKIQIAATDYKFTPSEFTVAPGRAVSIVLANKGKKPHNIQFSLPGNNKLKISQDLAPGATGTLEFTSPGPGNYSFICPVDLHNSLGMNGRMIVK
ncbi:MAG: cupredoxin domain-containing protein [Endomicrobiales bacterium]